MNRSYRELLSLFRDATLPTFIAAVAGLASGVISMLIVARINGALSASQHELSRLGAEFAVLCVGAMVSRWLAEDRFAKLGHESLARLRLLLARRTLDAGYETLERVGSPRLVATLTEDLSSIAHFLAVLPNMLMHGAVILGCLVYLAYLSGYALLIFAVLMVVGSSAYLLADSLALRFLRRARGREDRVFTGYRALFDGAKELKLHAARAGAFASELQADVERVRDDKLSSMRILVFASSTGSLLFFAAIGAVLFVLSEPLGLDRHTLSGYALVLLYMILPLESLLTALPSVQQARVALEHLGAFLDDLQPAAEAPAPQTFPSSEKVSLRAVRHSYRHDGDDTSFEVGPIDLSLSRGQVVFLVGGNGSGKTTLAKLLVGLYAPHAGSVLVDGQPVHDLKAYRQLFSAIFSDFHLFDAMYGLDAGQAARTAQGLLDKLDLAHKVTLNDGRFSSLQLSQGQRKRLALLVAWSEDRPFCVFDEWAADQDPKFKDFFYRELLPELKASHKGVLVITHDDRYFALADQLVKLDSGQLTSRAEPARGAPDGPKSRADGPNATRRDHGAPFADELGDLP